MSLIYAATEQPWREVLDLLSRIRRAKQERNPSELALLKPVIRALETGDLSLEEVQGMDAYQALWFATRRAALSGSAVLDA